jgi:hypothetical protein
MAAQEWVVMAKAPGGYYKEAWRGIADGWFSALESVAPGERMMEMFAVQLDTIHFAMLLDYDATLPDAEMVKVLSDGSLRRMREPDGGV